MKDFPGFRLADKFDAYAMLCGFLTAVPSSDIDLNSLVAAFCTSKTAVRKCFSTLMRAALLTNHLPLYRALLEEVTPLDSVADLIDRRYTEGGILSLVKSALRGTVLPYAHRTQPEVRALFMIRYLPLVCKKPDIIQGVVNANVSQWYSIAYEALQFRRKQQAWLLLLTYGTYGFFPLRVTTDSACNGNLRVLTPPEDEHEDAEAAVLLMRCPGLFFVVFSAPEVGFGDGSAARFANMARLWHRLGKPLDHFGVSVFGEVRERFERYGFSSDVEDVREFAATVYWAVAFSSDYVYYIEKLYYQQRVSAFCAALTAKSLQAFVQYVPTIQDIEVSIAETFAQKIYSIKADDCADEDDFATLADAEAALDVLFGHSAGVATSLFHKGCWSDLSHRAHLQPIVQNHMTWLQSVSRRDWITACVLG
jgi:hypothetical protein